MKRSAADSQELDEVGVRGWVRNVNEMREA